MFAPIDSHRLSFYIWHALILWVVTFWMFARMNSLKLVIYTLFKGYSENPVYVKAFFSESCLYTRSIWVYIRVFLLISLLQRIIHTYPQNTFILVTFNKRKENCRFSLSYNCSNLFWKKSWQKSVEID